MTDASPLIELTDTIYGLIALMEQESDLLALSGPTPDIAELAAAKLKMAARLEECSAQLARRTPDWFARLGEGERAQLAEAMAELNSAAIVNSDVLERQIALSSDLLQAVGKELERATGQRGSTYSRLGDIRRNGWTMPLSVNGRY